MENEIWKIERLCAFFLYIHLHHTANFVAKPVFKVGRILPKFWQDPAIDTPFIEV